MPRMFFFLMIGLSSLSLSAQTEYSPADQDHQISIFFGGGSYYIDAEQAGRLQEFLDGIPNIEAYEIEIQGHTDNIGNRAYNQRLSEFRARTVQGRLINYPIPIEMMEILPLGEDAPSFDNDTWEGKLNNRRVDVILKRIIM